jgi:hypothetical protein
LINSLIEKKANFFHKNRPMSASQSQGVKKS